ncbi:MAG TPA: glycosyltransferase family 4 protein [Alphaproteobacteria bacterium]|nr:glycosyltransferase family 4 protein [Alphaproteobacteria bacterium]
MASAKMAKKKTSKKAADAKKIRICYVNPTLLIKRPVSEISSKIKSKGVNGKHVDTTVIYPKKLFRKSDKSLHHSKLLEHSNVINYSTLNLPLKSEQPIPVTFAYSYYAFTIFKNNDIVHMWVPYYITNLKFIFIKKLFFPKKKLILTMDTVPGYSFSMGKPLDKIFKIYNKLFGWIIYKTPDVVTLYGKSLVPFAIKAGIPKSKIQVISTGISQKDVNDEIRKKTRKELCKELNIPENSTIVVFAGLMVPRKGVEKIIEMAKILKKENIYFIMCGDGPNKDLYIQKAAELGLLGKMSFLGWRKDMDKMYKGSDLLVLPAEGEGLPGVVMEAMSYGLPCVASDIPCIPDLIEDGKSGYLCNKDRPAEFAKRIKELSKKKDLRHKMGHNSISKMKSFDWDVIISKYQKLYSELLEDNLRK